MTPHASPADESFTRHPYYALGRAVASPAGRAGRQSGHHDGQQPFDFRHFAALAEYEHDIIIERTGAGLASARAGGRSGARPFKMTVAKLRLAQAAMGKRGLGERHLVDLGQPGSAFVRARCALYGSSTRRYCVGAVGCRFPGNPRQFGCALAKLGAFAHLGAAERKDI